MKALSNSFRYKSSFKNLKINEMRKSRIEARLIKQYHIFRLINLCWG